MCSCGAILFPSSSLSLSSASTHVQARQGQHSCEMIVDTQRDISRKLAVYLYPSVPRHLLYSTVRAPLEGNHSDCSMSGSPGLSAALQSGSDAHKLRSGDSSGAGPGPSSSLAFRGSKSSASTDGPGPKRASKACENCRIRRTKCTGGQPCRACLDLGIQGSCMVRAKARPNRCVLNPSCWLQRV